VHSNYNTHYNYTKHKLNSLKILLKKDKKKYFQRKTFDYFLPKYHKKTKKLFRFEFLFLHTNVLTKLRIDPSILKWRNDNESADKEIKNPFEHNEK